MSEEWKKFLLQWVLPTAVFSAIIVFLFAGFTANLKESANDVYADTLVSATKEYADDLANSINSANAMGRTVSNVISGYGLNEGNAATALSQITGQTEAYLAVLVNAEGTGVASTGDAVDMSGAAYFNDAYNNPDGTCYFVSDDAILGNTAIVITNSVLGDPIEYKVLTFYPMTSATIRKIVSADKVYDSNAFSIVVKPSGEVVVSSETASEYATNNDIWAEFEKYNTATSIRRIKNKVQAGSAGYFDLETANNQYLCVYTPIPNTGYSLMVNYSKSGIEHSEKKLYSDANKKLSIIIVFFVLFALIITALNVIDIFISSRKTEDLKDKADTDLLTGLKNKVATEREIKEYIAENPDSLAMLFMIDIDNFKKINDTMGHAFGDEVLRELGRHIGINFRVSDIIGRTGGDEFTVFLKNLKEDANTLREAQKLIYFFRHFQVGDYVKYSVTASIGAAVFPDHGSDFETLYKAADAAVYKSKKRGKNQLSFFDDRDRTPEEVAEADAHLIDIERKEETPIEN